MNFVCWTKQHNTSGAKPSRRHIGMQECPASSPDRRQQFASGVEFSVVMQHLAMADAGRVLARFVYIELKPQ